MKYLGTLVILLTGLLIACGDTNINVPSGPSIATNGGGSTQQLNVIEYRVNGNASSAKIKYSFPTDGLTLVTSVLPYDTTYSTSLNTIFVSLEATPVSFPFNIVTPFTSVQIFANGSVFREATSSDFLLGAVSVNGTWRR